MPLCDESSPLPENYLYTHIYIHTYIHAHTHTNREREREGEREREREREGARARERERRLKRCGEYLRVSTCIYESALLDTSLLTYRSSVSNTFASVEIISILSVCVSIYTHAPTLYIHVLVHTHRLRHTQAGTDGRRP